MADSSQTRLAIDEETRKREAYYEARGAARDLQSARDPEILMEGPAGTGKSRAVLEKLLACAIAFPACRILMVRKTRASMTESILAVFEQHVLPPDSPLTAGVSRAMRRVYDLPNKSSLIVAGLDDPTKIMSSEYDIIAAFEATELTQNDWEMLTTRLRNRKIPFQQGICECNPGAPSHWLNQRADEGRMRRLLSRHEDNPVLMDKNGQWTKLGDQYIKRLDALTGSRRLRLRYGKWCAAEGSVYPQFDRAVHVIKAARVPPIKNYFASIDWGYTNPGVLQVWGLDYDGRLYLVKEWYRTKMLLEWWIDTVRMAHRRFGLRRIVADPTEPSCVQAMARKGLPIMEADNDIFSGISSVQQRLVQAGDGKPRLFLVDDCLTGRDPDLVDKRLPFCTVQEFDVYMFEESKDGKNDKEEPADFHNHGMDAMRYAVKYADRYGNRKMIVEVLHHAEPDAEDVLTRRRIFAG